MTTRPPGRRIRAISRDDLALPERLRKVAVRKGLEEAGFVDIQVRDRPDWRVSERAMWAEAAALDPGDDPALLSFHEEGLRVLPQFDRVRRVMATAARPR